MSTPIKIERTLNANIKAIWKAITDKDQMKKWYFDLPEFKAEVGIEFHFSGGTPEKTYLHICVVKEVIEFKKISYSWRYDGYEGDSLVTFDLVDEGEKTKVILIHSGIETFSRVEDLKRENFELGWKEIIGTSLKDFVEKK